MDAKATIEKYEKKIAQDAKIAKWDAQARSGLNKWRAAQELASRTGMTAAEALLSDLLKEYPDGKIPEEIAKTVAVPVVKRNYQTVSKVAEAAQTATNREAGIGLKALVPEFDKERAEGIAKNIASLDNLADHKELIKKEIVNNSRSIVDQTIKKNAEAHEAVGLYTVITRTYDDVGVRYRTEPCQWCLDREGTWTHYSEAKADGVFERHPGCGCVIDYKVGKTHTISTNKGGKEDKYNDWDFKDV